MAWLRRLEPDDFSTTVVPLPPRREVPVGAASPESIALHPGRTTAPRHARFVAEGTGWRLEPHAHHTSLNGDLLEALSRPLRHGDLIWFGQPALEPALETWQLTGFVFEDRPFAAVPELERAVLEAPDDVRRLQVWADGLLERGDPFGEHLALALVGRAEPTAWIDSVAWEVRRGFLELEWRHGLVRRATVRAPDALRSSLWEYTLCRLFALRASPVIEALHIDLPTCLDLGLPLPSAELDRLVARLIRSPMPRSVRDLSFGYQTEGEGAERTTVSLPPEWRHLGGRRLFIRGARAELVVARIGPGLHTPLRLGQRVPLDGELIAVKEGDGLLLEPPDVRRPRPAVARFAPERLQWGVRGTGLELNGRPCARTELLSGDRLSIGELGLRFEIAD